MTIGTLKDLEYVLETEISRLMEISPAYLNDTGKAALEAYKAANWYCGFYDTIHELAEDESFKDLINIPDKHPEYYRIVRMINRVVEKGFN